MRTKDFIEKLQQDEKENNLVSIEKIKAAGKNPEAVYAIACEAGVTDSFEVFEAEMAKQYESISVELTDEELSVVAGGMTDGEVAGGVAGGIGGSIAAAAAAAGAL